MRSISQIAASLRRPLTESSTSYPTAAVYGVQPEISPVEVVNQFTRLVKKLTHEIEELDSGEAERDGCSPYSLCGRQLSYVVDSSEFLSPVYSVQDFVRRASQFARDRALPWPADAAEVERRLAMVTATLPRWVYSTLTGGKVVESVLDERNVKLVGKTTAATGKAVRKLLVGPFRQAFTKIHDAFMKDNPESSVDDFKIALLAMVDEFIAEQQKKPEA
jgi:hypothetical protein